MYSFTHVKFQPNTWYESKDKYHYIKYYMETEHNGHVNARFVDKFGNTVQRISFYALNQIDYKFYNIAQNQESLSVLFEK